MSKHRSDLYVVLGDPPSRRAKLAGKFLGIFPENFEDFSEFFGFNHDLQLDLA